MKVVILAGGFGTRLARDIRNDSTGEYTDLLLLPKSLLPVNQIPLLSHWMKLFQDLPEIEHIYIETNDLFYEQFLSWSAEWPAYASIVNDKTNSNDTRLGAVSALSYVTNHFNILNDDIIAMAGDTLFYKDFNLSGMINQFHTLKHSKPACSLVTVYDCLKDDIVKHGILETNPKTNQVTMFLEKPQPDMTSSRLACPCFYILSPDALKEVSTYLKEKEDSPVEEKDATGNFLNHLYQRLPVFTYKISGRFDVGGLPSYQECCKYFDERCVT